MKRVLIIGILNILFLVSCTKGGGSVSDNSAPPVTSSSAVATPTATPTATATPTVAPTPVVRGGPVVIPTIPTLAE